MANKPKSEATTRRGPFADVAPALDQITQEVLFGHLAFYAGWPAASAAVGIARTVFAEAEKEAGV